MYRCKRCGFVLACDPPRQPKSARDFEWIFYCPRCAVLPPHLSVGLDWVDSDQEKLNALLQAMKDYGLSSV